MIFEQPIFGTIFSLIFTLYFYFLSCCFDFRINTYISL